MEYSFSLFDNNILTSLQQQGNKYQALEYFSEAFYNNVADEDLEQTAVQGGA